MAQAIDAQGMLGIERRAIDHIPEEERHGSARSQFTLWFGTNIQITALVDGALAVVFGADALWAIIGLLLGNVLGGIVMALHSAQGPGLGLPQMISSRAQFGVYGAVLPLVLVILMYVGFAATGTVLAGQATSLMLGLDSPNPGIVIFGALTAVVAIMGYRLIHVVGRISTVVGGVGFVYLFVRLLSTHDLGGVFDSHAFDITTFLLAVSLSAGWQLTFGPYVADYSRYLPSTTPRRAVFGATFLGSVLGAQVAMTLGVLIAAVAGGEFLANQVRYLGDLAGPTAIAGVIYGVIMLGKLTANTLNAYGGFMCGLTIVSAFTGTGEVSRRVRIAVITALMTAAVVVALAASPDFLSNFKNFVLLILMVFTPWSAINLADYYLVSKERFDIPALYDPDGRYRRWNGPALTSYAIGVVAQIPFLAQTLYTGPAAEALDGTDISWIVGLVVTTVVYLPWALRTRPPTAVADRQEISA
ncbi:cytosine permease [Nocardioides sp. LHD-245]|uniref:purine-cytosine permease family protein n=1 Tax=Nocardioides sp. LHD-245 TaxID=3051387 RepID=UPI0027E1063D|nr:cytosine permease [Nocardioides sp. LHD-245]